MRSRFAFALFAVLAACPASADESPSAGEAAPGVFLRPSPALMLVANYEGSLSDALDEDALTEKEQQSFAVDFQATITVKQARLEVLRAIHQLEVVAKQCSGTPAGDEAAQLLKLLPQRKDLQPGQAVAAGKKAALARRVRTAPAEATSLR